MWVVKIGGSLLFSDRLQLWLDALACYGGGNVVVVPGGGVFADQVRAAQRHWGYGGDTAHHMALLAMEQYGVLMTGLRPDLVLARSFSDLTAAHDRARVPVWMPRDMALTQTDLPATWEFTSDSLAAWLAQSLGAQRLLLVKSLELEGGGLSCQEVYRAGVVDPLFCGYASRAGCETWICASEAHSDLPEALHAGSGCGVRIACGAQNGPALTHC